MQLIEIDKARYRKHLNRIIVAFIVSLLVLSLAFGTLLISLFSTVGEVNEIAELTVQTSSQVGDNVASNQMTTEDNEQPTNFKFNLLGVILALLVNATVMRSVKDSQYFTEVYYVWQVKQLQNLIYRKLKKIKAAAKEGDENALIILSFYYHSQLQVYQLDDNTITLDTIKKHLQDVEESIAEHGLTISHDQFEKSLIAAY